VVPALAALQCFGMGFAMVSLGWTRGASPAERMLKFFLSAGYGLGAFSTLFLVWRALNIPSVLTIDVLALAVLLIGWLLMRRLVPAATVLPARDDDFPGWFRSSLTAGFGAALGAALYCAVRRTMAYPNGQGWDAFAIWNLHARFLFRGGAAWREGFSASIPWSHPDYPLLLPAAIAHFWSYLGHETYVVPSIIGLVFTISTVGVLFFALMILRGRNVAMLGGLALMATPSFIEQGTSQYADIPLSFFILATVVMLCLGDATCRTSPPPAGWMALAGLAAGFAAWTKNEGLLFLCSLLLARFLMLARGKHIGQAGETLAQPRSFTLLFVSALPILLIIVWFKRFIAPPGDLFVDSAITFHKFSNLARYAAICKWFGKQFFRFGHWLWVPGSLLVVGIFLAFRNWGSQNRQDYVAAGPETGLRLGVVALTITLCGYFLIYVITPYDVYWHLRFSLNRLFLQLWPSAIFLCFLQIRVGTGQTGVNRDVSK
jgi:Dolichyl-phosphate-mannose-protein mannosyltransferase